MVRDDRPMSEELVRRIDVGRASAQRSIAACVAAAGTVGLAAQVALPVPGALGGVPITGQSLAVLVSAALLGSRRGALAAAIYVALAALGAPILAEGRGGWDAVRGSSAGFLIGFVLGAAATGRLAARTETPRVRRELTAQLAGTVVILTCGWARLAWLHGPAPAFRGGVEPFLLGAGLKALLGALIVVALRRVGRRR